MLNNEKTGPLKMIIIKRKIEVTYIALFNLLVINTIAIIQKNATTAPFHLNNAAIENDIPSKIRNLLLLRVFLIPLGTTKNNDPVIKTIIAV